MLGFQHVLSGVRSSAGSISHSGVCGGCKQDPLEIINLAEVCAVSLCIVVLSELRNKDAALKQPQLLSTGSSYHQ